MENRKSEKRTVTSEAITEIKTFRPGFFSTEASLYELQEMSLNMKMKIVLDGISKRDLEQIKRLLGLDYDQLSELLMVTNRTMHLKKGNARFSPIVSDRIIMTLELFSHGTSILGGLAQFQQWINAPNDRFRDQSPLSVLKTHSGFLVVRDLLTSIRNGHP